MRVKNRVSNERFRSGGDISFSAYQGTKRRLQRHSKKVATGVLKKRGRRPLQTNKVKKRSSSIKKCFGETMKVGGKSSKV